MNGWLDRRAFLGVSVAAALSSKSVIVAKGTDPNLVVFLSDMHVGGGKSGDRQAKRLASAVDAVLAMRPLPAYCIVPGDIAKGIGAKGDYLRAKVQFDRLDAVGVTVTFALGNHDRRDTFAEVFPKAWAASAVPGRLVSLVEAPRVGFVLLDTLGQNPDPGRPGLAFAYTDDQHAFLERTLAERKKPLFVVAHNAIENPRFRRLVFRSACVRGVIHGHEHAWFRRVWRGIGPSGGYIGLKSLSLPSTGDWGDIGWALMRVGTDTASVTLHQSDYWYPEPGCPSAAECAVFVKENAGATCSFSLR